MRISIIVLVRGTTEEVASWEYEKDQASQPFIRGSDQKWRQPEDFWRWLALDINQRGCQSKHLPIDVFLILRGNLSENIYDPGPLVKIVSQAHEYSWGGNIYIVWDQKTAAAFDPLYRGNETVLKKWFVMLVEAGVTDLIEIKKKDRLTESDEKKILYERALESAERRESLRKLVSRNGWRVVLRDGASFLDSFVQRLSSELPLPEGENVAVFYDQRPPRGWSQLRERAREYDLGGKLFVAALSRSNPKDMRDLEELWEQEWPGLKLFVFKGIFEWLYAFVRLARSYDAPAEPADLTHDDIIWVTPPKGKSFDAEPDGGDVRLLVTSAFAYRPAPGDSVLMFGERPLSEAEENEMGHCLDAAQEIGDVIRHLPFHVEVQVLHCITCERLPDFLEDKLFTAWLHLGHGDERGLHEEHAEQSASSQRWLDSFSNYGRSLELVIFSACESAGLACSFAESGLTRVAVGFENSVLTDATRKFSGKVMPVALRGGDRQEAILQAFLKAGIGLRRRSYEEDGEDKYYSDAVPKAFAVKLRP